MESDPVPLVAHMALCHHRALRIGIPQSFWLLPGVYSTVLHFIKQKPVGESFIQ